jgi:acid phosphatase
MVLAGVMAAAALGAGPAAATCGPAKGLGPGADVECPAITTPIASLARSRVGYSHVVVVIEENSSGPAVIGGGQAPYLKGLAGQGEYFPNYRGVSHPSEPNYLALFSGSTLHTDGSDNCIKTSARSIVGEARAAGVSVEGYVEGLSSGSNYACRHDAFSQFSDAKGAESDFSKFPSDYARLPKLSFVVPNLVNDMGDNGNVADGDRWAKAHLSGYAHWAKAHNSLLIYVADESGNDPNYNGNQPGENGNNALALVIGARIPGKVITGRFDHYSMLRTLEDIFGLGHLGASARASDMFST